MSENNVTGIIGATVSIGQYIVNDYVITITPIEGDYGYTMTITRGSDVQTITLYGLSTEQYDAMLDYLEQAQTASAAAETAQEGAEDARDAAQDALNQAITYASNAATSASAAAQSAQDASDYDYQAAQARYAAVAAKEAAVAAQGAAEAAQTAAETSASNAGTSATSAATSATAAESSETSAAGSASSAAQSATNAAASASAAAQTLTSVQAEGAAQIAAIDAEGQEVLESIPADYTELSDDVADLKSQFDNLGTVANVSRTTTENVDLDITDMSGNSIARFADGDFRVKNFSTVLSPKSSYAETEAEFSVADISGNVVLQVENGNIKTKRFNSVAINPNIITVKQDGSGDFTSLRAAVESIVDADPITNPYIIEIYEGLYNVLADYTDEEIISAGEEHYTDTSFVGIKITNGISLRGVGCRDNVILYGYLDPTNFTAANRNNIATLNIQGESGIENLTVIGEEIRYAVHDDFHDDFRIKNGRNPRRKVINCVFVAKHTTGGASYGAGTSKARDYTFENCYFEGGGCGIHKATNMANSGTMLFYNCGGYGLSIGDYSTSSNDAVHLLIINNCDFDRIAVYKANNGSYNGQHIKVIGASKEDCFVKVPDGFVYKFGNVDTTDQSLSIGDAVTVSYVSATNKYDFYGVCIGTSGDVAYVQTSGFIGVSLIGLSAVAGDYVGISNGAIATTANPDDAIGLVVSYDSDLYVRLF